MSKIELGYMITNDPVFINEQFPIPPELLPKLEGYHHLAMGGKKSSVQKILDAIEQYPDNPQLKNYLSVLYGQLNDHQKMYDVNKWITAEHPNYLFGKLNLANEYYFKEEYDKMPTVLGREMDLKTLYPDRDLFHITEILSFLKTAVLYFTAIGDIEQAEIRYEIMDNLAPDSSDTKFAFQQIHNTRMLAVQKRYEEEQKSKISVITKPQEIKTSSQAPDFYHEEIEWLYCHGLYFPEDKLSTILSLPKETLVQDLELVLQDSINRYGFFKKFMDENGWDEEKLNFVIHALYLLAEIKAVKSIDAIFNILSQSEEYLKLYFEDILNELMWEIMFKIAANNLEACKQFMFKPGINTYARTVFPEMVEQVALHYPERREEVINWFKDVMQFFLNSTVEDNVIDSEAIAFLICHVIGMNGKELLPEIKELFDNGMVLEDITGDLEEVNKYILQPHEFKRKQKVLPIVERYKLITSTWAGFIEEKSNLKYYYQDYTKPDIKPAKAAPKIGRNEPCPCGSGKKYKKCCLRK